MPSTDKTNHGLNQWLPGDIPQFDDHNADNQVVEEGAMWKDTYDPPESGQTQGPVEMAGGIESYLAQKKQPVSLWTGTAGVGDTITIPNIRDYTLIGVRASSFAQVVLLPSFSGNYRGEGGYAGGGYIKLLAYSLVTNTAGVVQIERATTVTLRSNLVLSEFNDSQTIVEIVGYY